MTNSVRMASPPDAEEITALINSAFRTAEEFFSETDRISLESVNDLFITLMDAAEEYGRGMGCRFMDIKVVNLRDELIGFYSGRGYVETGTSPFPADIETKLPCHFIEMTKPLTT